MDFSIVIPTYNERNRLPQFLINLAQEIGSAKLDAEIIVIDDGSAEEHYKKYLDAIEKIDKVSVKIYRHERNRGKGAAIKTGFMVASGTWIGFVDADGATSPQEISRILKFALSSDGLDGIFGSRIRMLGFTIKRYFVKYVRGRIFATLIGVLLDIPIYDSQCGCKFFRKSKIFSYLELCKEEGYLFDIELISICCLKKLNLVEFPINWSDQPGGKVRFFKDSFKMAFGILGIKKRLKKMR